MNVLQRLAHAVGVVRAADAAASAIVTAPPARVSDLGEPRGMAAVYRAIQVITTAAAQLPLTVERAGQTLPTDKTPGVIRRPDPRMGRSEWITHMVAGLALHGNAYARIERDAAGQVIALRPLDPRKVWINVNPSTHSLRFGVEGEILTSADVLHAHLQPATVGEPLGLGPIQAARLDLVGARQVRDFAAQWFDGTGQPTGILSSPTATYEDALRVRNAWNMLDDDGNPLPSTANPTGIKILPKAFSYQRIPISPKEAQWIESQDFSILQIARLFGIPSTLALASPAGGSMTYSNVEQDWIAFTRFTLMAYLRPLEEALSEATVRGQDVRFNLEGLLRSDTKTRYDSYAVALANGFMTVAEVRALENRSPLTITENTP